MLDTIHFGGGNTSYQAFAMNTPIVTLDGVFARDRSTQSFYNLMEWQTLVAPDRNAYVDLALRLGRDRDFRAHIKEELAARIDVLWNDDRGARGFAAFLTELFDRGSRP
jgi:predicted O-linked N-acetylglucosamine transferase (SPINDLY family)